MRLTVSPSTDEQGLNRTEAAYLAVLRESHGWVGIQCITLKLANDTRYTPDFWTIDDGQLVAHEVKGFFRDDAKVKVKVAARLYPFFRFAVVFKRKGGGWDVQPVKP